MVKNEADSLEKWVSLLGWDKGYVPLSSRVGQWVRPPCPIGCEISYTVIKY